MKADANTTREVQEVLERMTEAYESRDLPAIMACFAPDPDGVMYGTGADEKRVGPNEIQAQVERDWSQTESVSMDFPSPSVSAAGNVAWATLDGAFHLRAGGQNMTMPARGTVVLEKRDGQWLVVHSHFSVPASGQEEGESF